MMNSHGGPSASMTRHGLRGYPQDYGPFVDAAALDAALTSQTSGYPAGTMLAYKWLGETTGHQQAWLLKYITAGDQSQAQHIVSNLDTPEVVTELRAAYEHVAGLAPGMPSMLSPVAKLSRPIFGSSAWVWGGTAALLSLLALAAWAFTRRGRR
jgi:hypothetical protein